MTPEQLSAAIRAALQSAVDAGDLAITVPAALPPLLLGGWPMAAYATIPLLNRAVSPWLPEAPPAA